MKQLNIICLVFISMAGLVSCGQNKEETFGEAEHIIALTPSADTLNVSGAFAKSELISLTGCSVVKVSEAVQVPSGIAVKGKFYTLSGDSKTESEVALFSREGEFITHVARKGRGGEEVIDAQSIKYNPYRKTLDVLADYGRRIVCYDTQSWKIKCQEDLSQTDIKVAADFVPVSETQYLCYKNLSYSMKKEYKLYAYDSAQEAVVDKFLPLDKKRAELISFSQKNNLSSNSGKVIFYESFLKNMFVFADGSLSPYIEFADNEYQMPESDLGAKYNGLRAFLKMCKESGHIWGDVNYYFLGDKVYSMFEYGDKLYYNVMNLKDDTSHSYSYVNDDMSLGVTYKPQDFVVDVIGATDEALILSVDSYKLNKIKNGTDLEEVSSEDAVNSKLLLLSDN